MAITSLPQDEKKDQNQPQGITGPVMQAGGPINAAAPTGQQTTPQSKPVGSGRFTNIQAILKANRGGGEKLANQIGQTVNKQSTELNTALGGASDIQKGIEAEKTRIKEASGYASSLQADPNAAITLANDPTKATQFGQALSGQTTANTLKAQGESTLGTARNELTDVQKMAGLTGTEAGRFELLRQSLGRPSYTQGQQKLDQLLVQSSGGNVLGKLQKDTAAQVQAGQQKIASTEAGLNTGLGDIGTAATTAQTQLKSALGTLTGEAPTGALGKIAADLKKSQQEAQIQSNLEYGGLMQNLTNKKLTPENMATLSNALGIPADQIMFNNTVNPEDIKKAFQQKNAELGAGMTPEQLAQYKALQKLSGRPEEALAGLNESLVGQKAQSGIITDTSKLGDVGKQMQTYANELKPYTNELNQNTRNARNLDIVSQEYQKKLNNALGGGRNTIDVLNAMLNDPRLANQNEGLNKIKNIRGITTGEGLDLKEILGSNAMNTRLAASQKALDDLKKQRGFDTWTTGTNITKGSLPPGVTKVVR